MNRIVSRKKKKGKGGKSKGASSLDWKWNICRTVTFPLDSDAAVSAAPESLGDDHPMKIEKPRMYKRATGEPVRYEGSRVSPSLTAEGLHCCTNFRVAFVTEHSCQSPSGRPEAEDQPMNPDNTVHLSEEVGVEGEEANLARGFPRLQHSRHAEKFRNTY